MGYWPSNRNLRQNTSPCNATIQREATQPSHEDNSPRRQSRRALPTTETIPRSCQRSAIGCLRSRQSASAEKQSGRGHTYGRPMILDFREFLGQAAC